jgi:hypothetical protein
MPDRFVKSKIYCPRFGPEAKAFHLNFRDRFGMARMVVDHAANNFGVGPPVAKGHRASHANVALPTLPCGKTAFTEEGPITLILLGAIERLSISERADDRHISKLLAVKTSARPLPYHRGPARAF